MMGNILLQNVHVIPAVPSRFFAVVVATVAIRVEAVGEPAAGMVVTVRPQAPARSVRRLPAKAKAFRV